MKDRYGDDVVDLHRGIAPIDTPHDRDCRRGWLGTDPDGNPIPCLTCRPHLRAGTATVYDSDPNRTKR